MVHVMIRGLDGSLSVSPMEVRTVFRVSVPGDPSMAYRLNGIDLIDPQNYCVGDLRIGGRSQFSKTSGEIPGEAFVACLEQVQLDPVIGGSTIDLELICLVPEGNSPSYTVRLTAKATGALGC